MKKLVIIPAYNEENNICYVVNNIKEKCNDYDYIVINDCSKDNTEKVCIENSINHISLPINLGIGGAMQTGYIYAMENNYDVAIQVDGDGQHDIKYLDELVEKLDDTTDLVIGSRYIEKIGFQSSIMRRIGKNIISIYIFFLTGKKITDPTSGFRACNKRVINMFANLYPYDYPEPETIVRLLKNKCKVKESPVQMHDRLSGKSSINTYKSIKYMFKVIIALTFARLERREKNDTKL